ncbi:enoyl-CoA hydratase/isomerase family protein [Alphaproteobacteria bacterium]|nr:enoyl-CoA hydratase/isomerase family protein [Alphaproteobacteria bacterium]
MVSKEPESSAVTGVPKADLIEVEQHDGIAVIALNRPEVHNAMDDALRGGLVDIIDWVAQDDAIRAIVLTGRGRSFCAGGDIAAMRERLEAPIGTVAINGWQRQRRTHGAIMQLHGLTKPTVAAVNGVAAGLGCDLALCCDFIVASEYAKFAMSYVLRGLIPDGGGLYFLPRRVGLARAKELIFSGRRVEAAEALEIGMVDQIATAENLLQDSLQIAERMTAGSSVAVALSKSILDQSFELPMDQLFALGRQAQAICYTTNEHRDAVDDFLNKRKG